MEFLCVMLVWLSVVVVTVSGRVYYKYLTFSSTENKPIMYEKSFLQDVAYQNFSKYDVKPRTTSPVIVSVKGKG